MRIRIRNTDLNYFLDNEVTVSVHLTDWVGGGGGAKQCFGSGSAQIRINKCLLDPDPHEQMCNFSILVFTYLDPDPDPYGHYWDPGSGSA